MAAQIKTSPFQRIITPLEWLVRPSARVQDVEKRQQSQLLSALLLVLIVTGVAIIAAVLKADPNDLYNNQVQGAFVVLGTAVVLYVINRLGFTQIAALAFILTFTLVFSYVSFGAPIDERSAPSFAFLFVPILLLGIFFQLRWVILMASVILVLTLLEINTEAGHMVFWAHRTLWYFFVFATALLITFILHLNNLEKIRRAALEDANSKLRASEVVLEQRVIERTHELDLARHEAETARAAAEQANEVKSRFLANMSHELRTPLNAILNFTAFVADGVMGPVNEEQADVLNQAIGSSKHLLSLINDVLDITKIEAGMMDLFVQDIDMNATLAASVSVAKGLVKDKSLHLITEIEDNLPLTYGDRRRVRQVFLNLISNAIKFTHQGHVSIRAYRKDAGVEIVVEDTGIGIAPEDQHLVFETFRQVNKHDIEVAGTGLGLPISKHFVELHGGRMWFTSADGLGTIFYVYLPVLTEAEAEALAHTGEAA
jgi:signal transduction histidine kinase